MIIALEAASSEIGLALADADGTPLAAARWESAQRQSAELLPRLLELLAGERRALQSTTALAVGTGPGSFTGLRVAMALAKGLALGLDRPIVGIASLGAWLDAGPSASAAVSRAGAREAYVLERGGRRPLIADAQLVTERLSRVVVVAPAELAAAFGLENALRPEGAPAIARRAAERLVADPAGDELARLEPVYLRAPRGVPDSAEGQVRWL